ncbi:tetratricopeptide repeat protein [Microbispora sp. NEAU-D428]|uniref:tetratricopeptide repeat protein n=1 Tax=Microbispora sitophila TaxID=2771537 RepID=UPI001866CEBE|nr:tetratricopeptide repeat protein [Microbispora sitophila]MBE3015264.1 tetratricopeptide repeat protein [Microbispora sitophila]
MSGTAAIRAGLEECAALPEGRQKTERLEVLSAQARTADDRALEGEVLLALVEAYMYAAESDRMPVAAGRLLRLLDDFPAELGRLTYSIHWQLKWMTHSLVDNPAVPLETTHRWLDELQSRYREHGYSARPVLTLRSMLAQETGDLATAAAAMEAAIAAPKDVMTDCDACEHNGWGTRREAAGDDEGALEFWAPLLDGTLTCAEEPHRVLGHALLPLLRTGRVDDARGAHLKGYHLARRTLSLRETVGRHIEFCALTGNEARGLEILGEHVGWLTPQGEDVSRRLGFICGAAVLLRRLAALGHDDLPVGGRTAGAVLGDLEREIGDICARYDARNGTRVVSERVAARLSREPLLDRLPLGSPVRLPRPAAKVAVPAPPRPAQASLDDLVAEARRLSALRHPHTDEAWERVGAAETELPEPVAAQVELRRAGTAMERDPGAAHARLLAVAARFERLGDRAHALEARAAAAVALVHAGDRAGGEGLAETVTAEAAAAYAQGTLDAGEYLAARRAGAYIAMNTLAGPDGPDGPAETDILAARARVEAELSAAEELGGTGRAGTYHNMLARIFLMLGDLDAARTHLTSALDRYRDAGMPWHAARPAGMLGRIALDQGDPKSAEGYASTALEYGGDLLPAEEAAELSSLLVDALIRQPGRELDVVGAALAAAARWDGLSEPDTLHNTFAAARAYHLLDRHGEAAALFEEVMPRVEVPYEGEAVARTRAQYGRSLAELGRHREAAEQFVTAARLVQDDPGARELHAELAWSAAESLQFAGMADEALPAYQRAARLWADLGMTVPRVRCLRAAAWLMDWTGEDGDIADGDTADGDTADGDTADGDTAEPPGVTAMRAVLAELEFLAGAEPSEEIAAELAETRRQLDAMLDDGFDSFGPGFEEDSEEDEGRE